MRFTGLENAPFSWKSGTPKLKWFRATWTLIPRYQSEEQFESKEAATKFFEDRCPAFDDVVEDFTVEEG